MLQWGAKRDFIRRLHNSAPRLAVAAKVLSAVRVLLTRSQKKRKRRRARQVAAAMPRLAVLTGVSVSKQGEGVEEVVVLSP